VTITTNPANSNPQACEIRVDNPHESTGTPGAVDAKAWIKCNYSTTAPLAATLWKCDSYPLVLDSISLESGDYGCTTFGPESGTFVTMPGIWVGYVMVPPFGTYTIAPDGKYFVAYGESSLAAPQWSNIVGPLY
jgi:hypothetical protein